jgi:NAD(P)-dependent dehydrogenase (short-subunit alcohol dehydrogenase family)
MRLLENRVAVVAGATRGIGLAIARTFASHGASVLYFREPPMPFSETRIEEFSPT